MKQNLSTRLESLEKRAKPKRNKILALYEDDDKQLHRDNIAGPLAAPNELKAYQNDPTLLIMRVVFTKGNPANIN